MQLLLVESCSHPVDHLLLPVVLLLTTVQLMVVSCSHTMEHLHCTHILLYSLKNITNSTFTNNSATILGGVIYCIDLLPDRELESLNIYSSSFYTNKTDGYGGIMFTIGCRTYIADSVFDHNLGSLYIFNSNLTISGCTTFENCAEPSNKTATEDALTRQEGGAKKNHKLSVHCHLHWSNQLVKQPSKAWWSNISYRE